MCSGIAAMCGGTGKRHPVELGAAAVEAFLTHPAVNLGLATVSQNQALNALMFLCREGLKVELGGRGGRKCR